MLLGGDVVYKDMIRVAFGMLRVPNTVFFFETKKPDVALSRNILAAQALREKCEWIFYLDSVPSYTPVIVKDTVGRIDIKPISELATFTNSGLERQPSSYLIRDDDDRWVRIKHVVRHPFKGTLRRISTVGGIIDLSLNHCVYGQSTRKNGNLLDAKKLKLGMSLAMPRFWAQQKHNFFLGREDLAWLYGFFTAEGSVTADMRSISLANLNEGLILRTKEVFEDYFNRPMYLIHEKEKGMHKVECSDVAIGRFLRDKFYTCEGQKKVPSEIIVAPTRIKLEFLKGYNAGDGDKSDADHEFQSFACGCQIEAMGLIYLLKSIGLNSYSIDVREDKPDYVQISINKQLYERGARGKIKKIIDFPYEGYLCDIETESHHFTAGVGNFKLHNSDVVPPLHVLPDLLLHNLPIVSALYWRRYEGLEPCIYRLGKDGVPVAYSNEELVPYGTQLLDIDGCGAGCLLIHSSVFEKLKPSVEKFDLLDPSSKEVMTCWKFWEYIVHSRVNLSEDIVLASRVKGLGYRIFADLSLKCGHLTNVLIKDGAMKQTPLVTGHEV